MSGVKMPRVKAVTTALMVATLLPGTGRVFRPGSSAGLKTRPTSEGQAGPAPGETPILKRRLSNGLDVWLVEHHDVPIVQISLVVPHGTGDDPAGKYGVASLVSAMLTEGAGSRTAADIADAVDRFKGNLAPTGGIDSSSVQLHVTAEGLSEALPVFADVIMRPTFPDDALQRVKQERLRVLRQARDDPDAIASLALSRVIFGRSHRYGTALIGSTDSVAALTRQDLQTFYSSSYQPADATLLVVGDIVSDDVMKMLEASLGAWKPSAARAAAVQPPSPPQAQGRLVLIDLPGAPQARLAAGVIGAARTSPEYFALQVTNSIVRVRLTERLGTAAAGVRAGFDFRKDAGPFVAAAAVRPDKTADSIRELTAVLASFQEAVSDDELARAKAETVQRLPTFELTGRITARLQLMETLPVYGLPDDYYATYNARVAAVTAAEVRRVAQQFLSPDRLAIVVVGDLQSIEPSIRTAGSAPIVRMTIDEVFAPSR
jgi:zinc protease